MSSTLTGFFKWGFVAGMRLAGVDTLRLFFVDGRTFKTLLRGLERAFFTRGFEEWLAFIFLIGFFISHVIYS
jgi:hypothetical protein